MHTVPAVQRSVLAALVALTLLAGVLLFVAAPKASADLSQCPANAVCVWEGRTYDGNFSWWAASDTGCHNHVNNPNLRSIWNRTGYWVGWSGTYGVAPGVQWSLGSGYLSGPVCWPV